MNTNLVEVKMIDLTEKEQEARKRVCLALDVPTVGGVAGSVISARAIQI